MEVEGVGGSDATLRVVGPEGVAGEGTFGVPSGTEERWVTIVTGPLPAVVKAYTPASLSWSARPPGVEEFGSVGMTSHRLYVTLGTPTGSEPTNRRMNMLCNAAWEAGTPLEAIDGVDPEGETGGIGVHAALDDDPPLDPYSPGVVEPWVDDWQLMAGVPWAGECHDQAAFMNLCLLVVGAPGGIVEKIKASTDTNPLDWEYKTASDLGIIEDLDGDGTVGEEVLTLIFDFDPPEGDWNNFEGALHTAGSFYAVWPSHKSPSACELLLWLLLPENEEHPELGGEAAKQYWVFERPDGSVYHYPDYSSEVAGPLACP